MGREDAVLMGNTETVLMGNEEAVSWKYLGSRG